MGAISEILNNLGYDEYPTENSSVASNNTYDNEDSSNTKPETPKGYLTNGVCAGCELSARYF